ncbi:C-type lectin domain family 11 member A [Carcharodon carcharias]|uniref:C-type lectin domain family 11 member A n=1 Tax=Carcharodon carcharias TaxID=13397 RepID=UPI001B7DD203|nr:C-type lectin domain family 11 member A [Carcharodon carcharias]
MGFIHGACDYTDAQLIGLLGNTLAMASQVPLGGPTAGYLPGHVSRWQGLRGSGREGTQVAQQELAIQLLRDRQHNIEAVVSVYSSHFSNLNAKLTHVQSAISNISDTTFTNRKGIGGLRGCAKGRRVNAKCFLGVKAFETFDEGARLCGEGGGRLASPRGALEMEALAAYTKSFFGPGNWPAWIGVTDRLNEGAYVYQDGTRSALSDHWFRDPQLGQPNGGRQENCVALSTDDGKWWDKDCMRRMYYICEYDY